MAARLGALCDDDVHALLHLLARLRRGADQRRDLHPLCVRLVHDVLRRRPQRIHDQTDRMTEPDLDLRAPALERPAE